MPTADEEFALELARLSAVFVAQLPQRIEVLSDDLVAWLSAPGNKEMLDRLSHEVHQLIGAGSTFGCSGISDAARVVEQYLAEVRSNRTRAKASAMDRIEAAMGVLRGEVDRIYTDSTQGAQRRSKS